MQILPDLFETDFILERNEIMLLVLKVPRFFFFSVKSLSFASIPPEYKQYSNSYTLRGEFNLQKPKKPNGTMYWVFSGFFRVLIGHFFGSKIKSSCTP